MRVVCGRSDTIATLVPTSRFTSVDLPTLGRPTSETNPERNSVTRWPAGRRRPDATVVGVGGFAAGDAHRHDAAALHPLGPQLEALEPHDLALLGHVAEEVQDQPADGVPLRVGQLGAELLADVVDRRAPGHAHRTVGAAARPPAVSTSYSSAISPTISSSRSSRVTSPDVPPYSSITIAMWNCLVRISRSSSATRFCSGTKIAGRTATRTSCAPFAGPGPAHEILQVHEADDVVGRPLLADRQPREAPLDGPLDGVLDGVVGVDRDHVGARQHHLAHDGVAELEDRVDQASLLASRWTSSLAATSAIVRISSSVTKGPCFRPLPGRHDVGHADQEVRRPPQRREVGEEPQHRRERERGALGVLHREGLRRDLPDHEEEEDLEHDADDDAPRAGRAFEQHTDERGHRELTDEHQEQHDVERLLRVLEHLHETVRPLVAVFRERDRPDAVHPDERGLRRGEEDRQHEEHDDDREDRPVGTAHVTCLQPSSCWKRSSSSRSRRCIDAASCSSAWS